MLNILCVLSSSSPSSPSPLSSPPSSSSSFIYSNSGDTAHSSREKTRKADINRQNTKIYSKNTKEHNYTRDK